MTKQGNTELRREIPAKTPKLALRLEFLTKQGKTGLRWEYQTKLSGFLAKQSHFAVRSDFWTK